MKKLNCSVPMRYVKYTGPGDSPLGTVVRIIDTHRGQDSMFGFRYIVCDNQLYQGRAFYDKVDTWQYIGDVVTMSSQLFIDGVLEE